MSGPTVLASDNSAIAAEKLKHRGISPTKQRIAITRLLFDHCTHLSADDIYRLLNKMEGQRVSKATVYNTLGLLVKKGVIRQVIVDPNRIFYDPNINPHHHLYDIDSGCLYDIDASKVQIHGLPALPTGTALEGVDIIVRFRSASQNSLA